LMEKERFSGLRLSTAEREELSTLQRLTRISDDAPMRLVRQWADGGLSGTRSMSVKHRQLETLAMRWPKPRLSGRQAIVELYRIRGEWVMTPKQIAVERLRWSV
jgi:hypothetical protein